jgi:hypothetical protein
MGGMRKANESSQPAWAIAIVAVLLLLAYPFSMGPAHWLCTDSTNQLTGIQGQGFLTVYCPLIVCYQRGPEPMRKVIGAYLRLWKK